jgi:hypothetical protein
MYVEIGKAIDSIKQGGWDNDVQAALYFSLVVL